MKNTVRRVAIVATCLGIGVAFPAAGSANSGGAANSTKPCPGHGKHHHKHGQHNQHGKKCGFTP